MPFPESSPDAFGRRDPAVADRVRRREQGRRRVTGTTRWAVAAAAAGAAVLGAGYAHAIPGTSARPPATAPGGGSHTGTPGTPGTSGTSGTSSTSGGLRTPGQAPGTTTQAPHTQSGAS